jgi:hypothetical protein
MASIQIKKFPAFSELEVSVPYLKEPITAPSSRPCVTFRKKLFFFYGGQRKS